MTNYKYEISLYSPFVENKTIIEELYLPIIGKDAIAVYDKLWYLYKKNSDSLFTKNHNHNDLLKRLEFNWNEFEANRKKLEAVNLLKTYLDEYNETYYYVLVEPLNFDEFISDAKMYALLRNRITETELTKITYYFTPFTQTSKMLDISASVDYLITETEQREVFMYDFAKLLTKLAGDYKNNFNISYESKKLIDDAYNEKLLTFEQIYKLVCECICKNDNKFIIDANILKEKIDACRNDRRDEELCKTLRINRSYKIFDPKEDLANFNDVIRDYKKYKSENYAIMASKRDLNDDIRLALKELRTHYDFSDEAINVIIDYVAIKNSGYLNKNYILKIANSLHAISHKQLDEVLAYFRRINTKIYNVSNIAKINQTLDKLPNTHKKEEDEYDLSNFDEEQLKIIKSLE